MTSSSSSASMTSTAAAGCASAHAASNAARASSVPIRANEARTAASLSAHLARNSSEAWASCLSGWSFSSHRLRAILISARVEVRRTLRTRYGSSAEADITQRGITGGLALRPLVRFGLAAARCE
eukprot:scaffold59450_cov57-Phaeocystis_antarctica.AAC.8